MSKVWATRDNKGKAWPNRVSLRLGKPINFNYGHCGGEEQCHIACATFKTLFGFTPRMGSCKRMELSLKEIE